MEELSFISNGQHSEIPWPQLGRTIPPPEGILARGGSQRLESILGISQEPDRELEREFKALADRWHAETMLLSSSTDIILHDAYQQIMCMGPRVIPLVLRDLRERGGQWFWALEHLARTNPVPESDLGNIKKQRDAWLKWAASPR